MGENEKDRLSVTAKNCSVTSKRLPATYIDSYIKNPGVARTNVVVGDESKTSMKDFHDFV
jgi:hypothetical protein